MHRFLQTALPKKDCDELFTGDAPADLSSLFDFFAHSPKCVDKTGPLQSFVSKLKPALRKVRNGRNLFAHGHSLLPHQIEDCLKAVRLLTNKFSDCQVKKGSQQGVPSAPEEHGPVTLKELGIVFLKSWPEDDECARNFDVFLDSPPTNVSRLLLTSPHVLVGHDELLQQIEARFTLKEDTSTARENVRVLLHGPPGVGKTALVRTLAARLERNFPEQHSFQASTEATLKADVLSFLEGLAPLGAMEGSSWKDSFWHHLSQIRTRLLLVFEDVRSPSLVMSLLPQDKHHVMFTSVSEIAWIEEGFQIPEQVMSVPVPELSIENAMNLLQQVVLKFGDRKKVDSFFSQIDRRRELCAFLIRTGQNTPLAIRLVAFQLCQRGGDNLREVLEELEAKEGCPIRSVEDQKAAGPVHVRGFHHVVRYTMEVLSGNKTAVVLSYAFCLLPSDGVARWFIDLLGFHLDMRMRETGDAVNVLVQAGLVTAKEEVLIMHHAIQKEVRVLLAFASDELRNFVATSIIGTIESKVVAKGGPSQNFPSATLVAEGRFTDEAEYRVYLERRMNNWISLELERVADSFLKHSDELRLSKSHTIRCMHHLESLLERRHASPRKELVENPPPRTSNVHRAYNLLVVSKLFCRQSCASLQGPNKSVTDQCQPEDSIARNSEQVSILLNDDSVEVLLVTLLGCLKRVTVLFLAWINVSVPTLLEVYAKGKNFRVIVLLSRVSHGLVELGDPESAEKVLFSMLEAGSDHFTRECISWEDLFPILELIDNVAGLFYEQSLFSKSLQWWEVSYLLLNLVWGWHQPTTRVLILCLKVLRRIHEHFRSQSNALCWPYSRDSLLPIVVVWLHRGLAINDSFSLTGVDHCKVIELMAIGVEVLQCFNHLPRVIDLIDSVHGRLSTWINTQSLATLNDSGLRVLKDASLLFAVVHMSNPTDNLERLSNMPIVKQLVEDVFSGSNIMPESRHSDRDLQSLWKKFEGVLEIVSKRSERWQNGSGDWLRLAKRITQEQLGSQMKQVGTNLSLASQGSERPKTAKESIRGVFDVVIKHLKSDGSDENMLEHFQTFAEHWDKKAGDVRVLRSFLGETFFSNS